MSSHVELLLCAILNQPNPIEVIGISKTITLPERPNPIEEQKIDNDTMVIVYNTEIPPINPFKLQERNGEKWLITQIKDHTFDTDTFSWYSGHRDKVYNPLRHVSLPVRITMTRFSKIKIENRVINEHKMGFINMGGSCHFSSYLQLLTLTPGSVIFARDDTIELKKMFDAINSNSTKMYIQVFNEMAKSYASMLTSGDPFTDNSYIKTREMEKREKEGTRPMCDHFSMESSEPRLRIIHDLHMYEKDGKSMVVSNREVPLNRWIFVTYTHITGTPSDLKFEVPWDLYFDEKGATSGDKGYLKHYQLCVAVVYTGKHYAAYASDGNSKTKFYDDEKFKIIHEPLHVVLNALPKGIFVSVSMYHMIIE